MKTRTALMIWLLTIAMASTVGAGQGLVALNTGAGTCDDGSGDRYVDCGNGTVTDTLSGLIWLQNANCFGTLTWTDASLTIAGLSDGQCGLTDGSSPGEWRLPSNGEWAAAVAAAVAMTCPTPTLTNDKGTNCFASDGGSSFTNVPGATPVFWSATVPSATPGNVLTTNLAGGGTGTPVAKINVSYIWPVRLAQ